MTKLPVVPFNAIFVSLVYHCGPFLQLNKFTQCVQRLEGPLNLYNWKLLGLQSLQCRTVKSTRLYIVVRCGLYSVRLATISSSQQVGSNISYVTYGWVKHIHFISYSIIPNKSKHTKVRYSPEKLVWPPSLLVTVRIIIIIIININIVDNAPKNPYKC